jgi:hypothetical protein
LILQTAKARFHWETSFYSRCLKRSTGNLNALLNSREILPRPNAKRAGHDDDERGGADNAGDA